MMGPQRIHFSCLQNELWLYWGERLDYVSVTGATVVILSAVLFGVRLLVLEPKEDRQHDVSTEDSLLLSSK